MLHRSCLCVGTGEKGSAAQLARVLRPIMWRNSKRSTAGLGLDLPPRTLTLTRLHFTPAEHTFYAHILERTREARDALQHHQSTTAVLGPSPESPNQAGGVLSCTGSPLEQGLNTRMNSCTCYNTLETSWMHVPYLGCWKHSSFLRRTPNLELNTCLSFRNGF